MPEDVSIALITGDCLADVWPITKALFDRYWPDRPWPIYWCHTNQPVPEGTIPVACSVWPDYAGWVHNMKVMLDVIHTPFLVNWVEDLWLLGSVRTDLLQECVQAMRENQDIAATSISHYYHETADKPLYNEHIVEFLPGLPIRVAAIPCIWRTEVFKRLLQQFATPALFEQTVANELDSLFPQSRVISPREHAFTICDNAISEGHWKTCAIRHAEKEGLSHLLKVDPRGMSPYPSRFPDGNN